MIYWHNTFHDKIIFHFLGSKAKTKIFSLFVPILFPLCMLQLIEMEIYDEV